MDARPLISFCIPTYNFGRFIAETVTSIEDGAVFHSPNDFEIVILDGGSKDDTDTVVAGLVEKYDNIRYVKQAERGGIDRDMDTVAGLARGKYIWLFSSDDLLEYGWDKWVWPLLENTAPDVLLVPAVLCDINMKVLRGNPIFRGGANNEPIVFDIVPHSGSLLDYLNKSETLEALFGFMSALIIRSDTWNVMPNRPDYFGSCWAHCARLIPLLYRKTNIVYLNHFLIMKRGGNDSFMENGFVSRISIAVDGWNKIIEEFFMDVKFRNILYTRLRHDMPILLFIYAKITAKNASEIAHLDSMAGLLYFDKRENYKNLVHYLFYKLVPASAGLNLIIAPILPWLIKIRHYAKRQLQ